MNKLFRKYHNRAQEIAKRIHRDEAELVEILQKIEEHKIFRYLGYSSLFQYAVKALNLSENMAFIFINVARKARQVPELKQEIKSGHLTVCKAKKITSVINKTNANQWLNLAKSLAQKKLEKSVAKVCPKEATPEKASYVNENRLHLQLGVSEELMQKLRRIQDLISQKRKSPATLEESLEEMANVYLEKKDPLKKAQRVLAKKNTRKDLQVLRPPTNGTRTPIPAQIKHGVLLRDNDQCCYKNNKGERCEQRRWLDFHHLHHVSHGGLNTPENLQMLCFNHHKIMHKH